ncbi:HEAT repeat domain-containing protein [Actinoplanes awajinensis]|nr:HEAT repeat domain-containing protein [Actinoplanes awajinensis]
MSMSPAEVAHAVDEAMAAEEDRRWALVSHLQFHGGEAALHRATDLSRDTDPEHRRLAADILAQLGTGQGTPARTSPYRTEATTVLLAMAHDDEAPEVLDSVAYAFGHIGDDRCVPALIRLSTHASDQVRHGVVFGLLGWDDPAALTTLIRLTTDTDPEVRNWATFGLARQTDADTPELRAALAARLDDEDEIRYEAISGLALRDDDRAVEPMLQALTAAKNGDSGWDLTEVLHRTAARTGDPRLQHHLPDWPG